MVKERKLTGWHAMAIFGGCFAVIISVNLVLAYSAVKTFPGLETKNSYVASQSFDERREVQETLGWEVYAEARGGLLILSIKDSQGRPVQAGTLDAILGRATHVQDDRSPDFAFDGRAYVARETLSPGNWNIRMKATSLDGKPFEQRVVLHVES
ncbi:FixH family protein [Marivita sp.]|uniref:FixH family protein n=1 Tax=Marivita sp. TaxID=2003365 RepID=UPI003F6C10C5